MSDSSDSDIDDQSSTGTNMSMDESISINEYGVSIQEYQQINKKIKNKVLQCTYCMRVFEDKDLSKDRSDVTCYWCLFWLHYNPEIRHEVDGMHGKTIVEFIKTYQEKHDPNKCKRSDECIICDYKQGKVITNIIDGHLLNTKLSNKKVVIDDEYGIMFEI